MSPTDVAQVRGLRFRRYFTEPGAHPFDLVTWERRTAAIRNERGEAVFEQEDVEVPDFWSQTATNVVASKYFYGALGSPERESSARQLVGRVARELTAHGRETGFFAAEDDARAFEEELVHILIHQVACFNSPVWFNVGTTEKPREKPQCSACFILSVEDDMGSILDLAKTEGMLFKRGSGAGSNLSVLRSAHEGLSGGGTASGPVSFMKGLDAFAGVIKSGGTTRRAAKMVILDVDHPDVEAFITCKAEEEKKARALIEKGYDPGFDASGGAYDSVAYQNANHSVRVTDDFMRAVVEDAEWTTHAIRGGREMGRYRARDLLQKMAEAAWASGDPGMQFDTAINDWHTCPASGRIRASNPCSEYMFLDDTACNLASINLMRFATPEGGFDVEGFSHTCEVMISAQELIVDFAGYPTPKIAENSHRFRPLGLGYANLGALLMSRGLPYDSDEGRALAAAVTALMTGAAYRRSAEIAAEIGPFEGFAANREPMLEVIAKHRRALGEVDGALAPTEILETARREWDEALELGRSHGFRNSQATVLAPTGTIAFMMDCATTGIEPDVALVKYKQLVGGGRIKIVNRTVERALAALGYDEETAARILGHVETHDTIEGAPDLAPEHLPVFDCAFAPLGGERSIAARGHLEMLGAAQPFLSGAISKTVNMPAETTPEEIGEAFVEAWKLGLKAVAIYRDGCKGSQPLTTSAGSEAALGVDLANARRRLPDERQAVTHKFSINEHEGYITVGLYENGQPGEIFLVMAKEGSTISGLMDAFATSISIALQYGVPLQTLVDKFSHTRFEPSGFTRNPQIPIAKSITDYIFRWLASKFLDPDQQAAAGVILERPENGDPPAGSKADVPAEMPAPTALSHLQDSPSCHVCGWIMVRNGTCYKCLNCGTTSGCG